MSERGAEGMNEFDLMDNHENDRLLTLDQLQRVIGPRKAVNDRRTRPVIVGERTLLLRNGIDPVLLERMKEGRLI